MTVQLTLRVIPYVTLTVSGTTTTGLGTVLGERREGRREKEEYLHVLTPGTYHQLQ